MTHKEWVNNEVAGIFSSPYGMFRLSEFRNHTVVGVDQAASADVVALSAQLVSEGYRIGSRGSSDSIHARLALGAPYMHDLEEIREWISRNWFFNVNPPLN